MADPRSFDPDMVRRYVGRHQVARHILLLTDPRPPDGLTWEVDHINGDASDCRYCNLQWVTKQQHVQKNHFERGHASRP